MTEARTRDAARAIVLDEDDRILLLRYDEGHIFWAVPGGALEPGETHVAAAVRELHEELGLEQAPSGLKSPPAHRHATQPVAEVIQAWSRLTLALVGIGSLEPSPLLRRSGNAIAADEQRQLEELGAVGDVCTRYFDADGRPVNADFDERIIGIEPDQLRAIDRRIGVAGGESKVAAIRGAARGGWINVLITDVDVARALLRSP